MKINIKLIKYISTLHILIGKRLLNCNGRYDGVIERKDLENMIVYQRITKDFERAIISELIEIGFISEIKNTHKIQINSESIRKCLCSRNVFQKMYNSYKSPSQIAELLGIPKISVKSKVKNYKKEKIAQLLLWSWMLANS